MAKKNFWLGIPVMVLVFGMAVVSCADNDSTSGGTDPLLNGTWVSGNMELQLKNGNFEFPMYGKGTYTTSASNITMTVTHFHGSQSEGVVESKWYTKTELKTAVKNSSLGTSMSDAELDAILNDMFWSTTGTYTVSDNTLTLVFGSGSPIGGGTYTKK